MTGFPHCDPRALMELRVATDDATVVDVVALFTADYPSLITSIRSAVDSGCVEPIQHSAHRLKGSTGTLGLIQAQDLCLAIERAAKANAVVTIGGMVDELEASIRVGLAEIAAHVAVWAVKS